MTLQQLQYFYRLSRNLHLTKTANEFVVSPPAITAAINRLEEELGVTLFRKTGRRLELTEEGEIFQRHVETILITYHKAMQEMQNVSINPKQSLTIGVVSPFLWKELIEQFVLRHQNIKVTTNLITLSMISEPETLAKHDFLFCDTSLLNHESFKRLFAVPIDNSPCLAVYKSHPLAKRKNIALIEAKDERFIALNSDYSFRIHFNKLCELSGFSPNIILECDYTMRKTLLESKFGVLVTTNSIRKTKTLGDVAFVNIVDPSYSRTHSLFINQNSADIEQAILFREFVTAYYHIEKSERAS